MSENTLEFRRKTHAVKVAWGGRVVTIGGMNPIVVQSMTNTSTADVESSVAQVLALARAGSELVRLGCEVAGRHGVPFSRAPASVRCWVRACGVGRWLSPS